jgi:hypothetical protein
VRTALSRARRRLSFANVTSTMALFVALGGTSYAAITLPSNSVGKSQIRTAGVGQSEVASASIGNGELRSNAVLSPEIKTNAVGASEIRPSAIDSDELADKGIGAADLSDAAKTAVADMSAVTFRAGSTSAGVAAGGNATSVSKTGTGDYVVTLSKDVSACLYSATVAGVKSGATIEPAGKGFATATPSTDGTKVVVKTWTDNGTPLDTPFHLLVAC